MKEISFFCPSGVDSDERKNILYVVDQLNVTIINVKFDSLYSWPLPMTHGTFRGIKLDSGTVGQNLYLTIQTISQVFVCNSQDGKVLDIYGTTENSLKQGEFNNPYGITLNNKYIYVCDCGNHRVQILYKNRQTNNEKLFVNQWDNYGNKNIQFRYPYSIYYDIGEEIFYVGDVYNVQLITKWGMCLQKLDSQTYGNMMNQFYYVYGITINEDRLFVCDYDNYRIQIFAKLEIS